MIYNEQIKWQALNMQPYPIKIVECGIERVIQAADFNKPPQDQVVNLHSSCYGSYKSLFRVIKPPQESALATVEQKETLVPYHEKTKDKPLFRKRVKLTTKQKNKSKLLNKRKSNKGQNQMYKWTFENIETKKSYEVDKIRDFCKEHGISSPNNCYAVANKKPYKGWNITKVLIGD